MNRRTYLVIASSGVASLSGCFGNRLSNSEAQTDHATPSVELRPDPIPDGQPFTIDVSVVHQFTTERPAKICIQLTNKSSEKRRFRFGAAIPFGELVAKHRDSNSKLLLIPDDDRYVSGDTEDFIPSSAEGTCWKIQQAYGALDIERTKEFEPDESQSETYTLLSGSDGPCLKAGQYQAEEENFATGVTWGFDIILER